MTPADVLEVLFWLATYLATFIAGAWVYHHRLKARPTLDQLKASTEYRLALTMMELGRRAMESDQ